jgi:hypothetical protein
VISWLEVDSSAISAIAYDEDAEAIHVRYKDGPEWRYLGCSRGEWDEFRSPSTSKGKFVNGVLKSKPAERLL